MVDFCRSLSAMTSIRVFVVILQVSLAHTHYTAVGVARQTRNHHYGQLSVLTGDQEDLPLRLTLKISNYCNVFTLPGPKLLKYLELVVPPSIEEWKRNV
jgi:hypothetical protein